MYYILQTKWTGTLTPRLITEAGVSISHLDYNDLYQSGILQAPGTNAFFAGTSQIDSGTLRRYVAGAGNTYYQTTRNDFSGTATYVTGSHQLKAGVEFSNGRNDAQSLILNGDGISNFNNGVPVNFTAYNSPYTQHTHLDGDLGFFVTDTWHYKRVAVTAGVRFEYLAANVDPEDAPAGRFAPARTRSNRLFQVKGLGCWLVTQRLSVICGLFGFIRPRGPASESTIRNTAASRAPSIRSRLRRRCHLNVNTNPANGPVLNPAIPGQNCTQDDLRRHRLIPTSPVGGFAPQSSSPPSARAFGPSSNPLFGAVVGATTGVNLDELPPRHNYQYNVGLQQELRRGITLNVAWYRRPRTSGLPGE